VLVNEEDPSRPAVVDDRHHAADHRRNLKLSNSQPGSRDYLTLLLQGRTQPPRTPERPGLENTQHLLEAIRRTP